MTIWEVLVSEWFAFVVKIVVTAVSSYYVITKFRAASSRHSLPPPPGNRGYPVFGETFTLFTTPPDKFVRDRRNKYGDVFSSYLIGNPTIVVSTVEANRFFLEQEGSKSCKASKLKSMRNVLGKHQVNQANGDMHRRFYKVILSYMVPEVLKRKVCKIDEFACSILGGLSVQRSLVMKQELQKFTFFAIANLVFGLDSKDSKAASIVLEDIKTLTKGIVSIPINIPFFMYFKALQARKRLVSFFEKVICQRREDPVARHKDLLQAFLESNEEGRTLSTDEVIDNCIACLFAGHHTSAETMVWIMKFLHEHQQVLDNVRKEHINIMKKKGGGDYVLTWDDCQEMRLTWMVIRESLRLSNVPPAVIREITEDVTFQGYSFPKGWNMILNFSAIHVNSEHFPDPYKFDPDRFKMAPKRGSFIPFGAGSRTCAGKELSKVEMLIFIHRLVTTYKWEPAATSNTTSYRLLPSLENGYPVHLHKVSKV